MNILEGSRSRCQAAERSKSESTQSISVSRVDALFLASPAATPPSQKAKVNPLQGSDTQTAYPCCGRRALSVTAVSLNLPLTISSKTGREEARLETTLGPDVSFTWRDILARIFQGQKQDKPKRATKPHKQTSPKAQETEVISKVQKGTSRPPTSLPLQQRRLLDANDDLTPYFARNSEASRFEQPKASGGAVSGPARKNATSSPHDFHMSIGGILGYVIVHYGLVPQECVIEQ